MVNSRAKGCRGERQWRDVLKKHGWTEARRGQQYSGNPEAPDVVGGPEGYHVEVKHVERLNVRDAMDQATEDAGDKKPYVAWKKNNKPWLVILYAEDFLPLLQKEQTDEAT